MSYSTFDLIKENFSKETLLQFMKRSDDISILGYNGIDEFQKHLYETLYHQYKPAFLFNPSWNLETVFIPGTSFLFNWDVLSIQNYQNLSLSDNWTIQGDFLIENTSGVMNKKPVLLEKHSKDHSSKNYSISFNDNGQNHLKFEYNLENNATVSLVVDNTGIMLGTWYTYYFACSVENNIVEAQYFRN